MSEITVIKGSWFIPTVSNKQVRGTLTYKPDSGTELEIEEPFDEPMHPFMSDLDKADIILGESRNGDFITLVSCYQQKMHWGDSYHASWYANEIYVGCHANTLSALSFTKVVVQVSPLFKWLNRSGIKLVNFGTKPISATFNYINPDDIYFPIDERVTGTIRFAVSYNFPTSYVETIDLNHSAAVVIESVENAELLNTELWGYVRRFLNWLDVATGYPHQIENVLYYFYDETQSSIDNKEEQEVIRYTKKRNVNKRPSGPDRFIFDFPTVEKYVPDALTAWYKLFESVEVVIQILAENMGRDGSFSEFHFRDIIQALEAFHRKRIRNERMPKNGYKSYKDKILGQIMDEAEREFVKEQLNYGNEPRLRERLKELLERYTIPSLKLIIPDTTDFIRLVVDNRNYHTHLDSSGKKTILTSVELYYLSERALALLFVTIISEVIPDKDLIDRILRTSRRWSHLMKSTSS